MKKQFAIVMLVLVAACGGVLLAQRSSPPAAKAGTTTWEYGVFRVVSPHQYEWQDSTKRIIGDSLQIFTDKMQLQKLMDRLDSLRDITQSPPEYVAEGIFLNYLGQQGWELVLLSDRGPAGINNKTYWFKRPVVRSGR